jgi:cytoskeletal protein CcmA (bactofilin family)
MATPPHLTRSEFMSDPKRRLADKLGLSPTVIAESTTIVGNIETGGPLMVSGNVQGDGRIGGMLSIGKTAHWQGDIETRQAVIAGRVTGKIVVEDKLEIGASAIIKGEIVAKVLAIANGAHIDGEVTVTSGKAIVKFEERRHPA